MALELEYKGLRYQTHSEVYAPHDDTWLLVDAVRSLGPLHGRLVVEVGCGAGLGLLAAVQNGAYGIGIDRNRAALRLARENAARNDLEIDVVAGDLVSAVDLSVVELLLFNPPYLPTEQHERLPGDLNLAFDGGPTGNETLLRFADALVEAAEACLRVPELVLVSSSLNDRVALRRRFKDAGLDDVTELGMASFPFERLYAERFTRA